MTELKLPRKDLAPVAIPHGTPVEATPEYFHSKIACSTAVRKYPVWDVARPSPQVLIVQSRRELVDSEEKLAMKREDLKKHRTMMEGQWRELRDKQTLLKESFIGFNKFIRENDDKRHRTDRKMDADLAVLMRKTRETEDLKNHVAGLEDIKEKMEKQVREYTIYEDYLMSVVRTYSDFKQPLDVLNRYESLAAVKSVLADRQERDLQMLENARQEIEALTEARKLCIMGLNNRLASLRWKHDKVHNRVVEWEIALNRLKETTAKRYVEVRHVRAAIWSLYTKISKQKGLPINIKKNDFEQQLVVIMRALLELGRVYDIAHKRSMEKAEECKNTPNNNHKRTLERKSSVVTVKSFH